MKVVALLNNNGRVRCKWYGYLCMDGRVVPTFCMIINGHSLTRCGAVKKRPRSLSCNKNSRQRSRAFPPRNWWPLTASPTTRIQMQILPQEKVAT